MRFKKEKESSNKLKDSFVLETTGQTSTNDFITKKFWRSRYYHRVIDVLTERIKHRFSKESMEMPQTVDGLFTLNYKAALPFTEKYEKLLKENKNILEGEILFARNVMNNNKIQMLLDQRC